jgi:glycosyltransferase involved in cell wall biosynthesis
MASRPGRGGGGKARAREARAREAGAREAGAREAGAREAGAREAGAREAGAAPPSAPAALPPEAGGAAVPRFAIVIPMFRQPGLAAEALACALREAAAEGGVVVLVNDGCPYAQTQALCQTFAAAYPGRIDAVRTANAGLSAARNHGIRHALARFPSLGAIFLLDADNRLKPGALRRALAALAESGADWVYPDVDKFGLAWHGDMAGPYRLLRHLAENICDAACLIDARVFAGSLAFDPDLREGYEDWDFWLRCAAAGRRGAHCADLGFQYRARPESMVREADRLRPRLTEALQRRHASLYTPRHLLQREHAETPRFCLVHADQQRCTFTSAPGASSRSLRLAELEAAFWQAVCHPVRAHFPPFIVLLDRKLLLDLLRLGLADWLFWRIETALEQDDSVAVRLRTGSRIACTTGAAATDAVPRLLALRLAALRAVVADPQATATRAEVTLEAPIAADRATADAAGLAAQLRATAWREGTDGGGWRVPALIAGPRLYQEVRRLTGSRAPLARGGTRREAALLLPAGGAPLLAAGLRAAGWTIRLILPGAIIDPAAMLAVADVLCPLDTPPDAEGLAGLLAGCGMVIDCGALTGLALMGALRRQGVITGLLAEDATLALAWEHALELVVVPTARLRTVFQAFGVPAAKLRTIDEAWDSADADSADRHRADGVAHAGLPHAAG